MSRVRFSLLILAFVASCKDRESSAAADSDLARDLALVNQPAADPEFRDTALNATASPAPSPSPRTNRAAPRVTKTVASVPAPRPVVEQPRPSAPSPAPAIEAPAPAPARAPGFHAGVSFGLQTKSPVCTTNLPGDKIVAVLTAPVTGENGAYMPAGTTVVLEVASVTPGETPEAAQISLRVRSIVLDDQSRTMDGNVAIETPLERRQVPRDKNSDRRKVVGGAIAGAILGQIMGRDTKSTVIGAAAGAAAGTAAAMAGRQYDACLPAGGTLRVTTSQPITLGD